MIMGQKHGYLIILCCACILSPTHGQLNESFVYTSLTEVFPLLSSLETNPADPSPPVGRQTFSRCCLQAVSESYIIKDGKVLNNPNKESSFITSSPADLNATQWPCGAAYANNDDGAPEVKVPYSWCNQNCAGWQRSKAKTLSEWVQPFVGFILPSAVFCLHVPRKFVLTIGDSFFSNDFRLLSQKWQDFRKPLQALLGSLAGILLRLFGTKEKRGTIDPQEGLSKRRRSSISTLVPRSLTLGAKFMKAVSTFGTLCAFVLISSFSTVIRALAAASIALLNTVVWVAIVFSAATPMMLSGLYEACLDRTIIKDMRGSLLAAEAWRDKDNVDKREDPAGKREDDATKLRFEERVHQLYAILVGNLILPKNREPGGIGHSNSNTVWEDVRTLVERKRVIQQEVSGAKTPKYAISLAHHKAVTATRLKGMLGCQSNFGASVGAPIVFFLGSFLFSVISNFSAVGDNNTSHALAFGMWWMTIPHVAIVSGCLLAGNNPNTLEVIVCGAVDPRNHNITLPRTGSGKWYQAYFDSAYRPVWMLDRGRNKQKWIDRLAEEYSERGEVAEDSQKRRRAFHLDFVDWIEIAIITVILVIFPFVLAFLTSFFTPRVGLACRSLTFLLYFLFQVLFSALWVWDFFSPHHLQTQPSAADDELPKYHRNIYYFLLAFVGLGSGFTAVVGTLLQIIGVYRNCLCAIPIQFWISKKSHVVLSTNSKIAIQLAREFWLPTGIASIVLLVVTCYGGWWYQKHWRREFTVVVDMLCKRSDDDDADEYISIGAPFIGDGEDDLRVEEIVNMYSIHRRLIQGGAHIGKPSIDISTHEDEVRFGDQKLPHSPILPHPIVELERHSSEGLLGREAEERWGIHHSPDVSRPGSSMVGERNSISKARLSSIEWRDNIEMVKSEKMVVKRKPLPT